MSRPRGEVSQYAGEVKDTTRPESKKPSPGATSEGLDQLNFLLEKICHEHSKQAHKLQSQR
jgi:hypothetical protein